MERFTPHGLAGEVNDENYLMHFFNFYFKVLYEVYAY